MIKPAKRPSRKATHVERQPDHVVMISEYGKLKLEPKSPNIIRVVFTRADHFSDTKKPGVILDEGYTDWRFEESDTEVCVRTSGLCARVDRSMLSIAYETNEGTPLLRENERQARTLEAFDSFRVDTSTPAEVVTVSTPDGEKQVVQAARKIYDRTLYRAQLNFVWQDREALFGLGQHEEGSLNVRGKTIYLHQANLKIAVPMLVSNLGYGVLLDAYCPVVFNDNEYGSYLFAEAVEELDYYFIFGGSMDGVIDGYRTLTGKASLPPRWAFGYLQSQERYETQQEILDVAAEYRRRQLGLDCVILDWHSWRDGHWGEKKLDVKRFPEPGEMTRALHDEHVRFMISIWPNADEISDDYKEFAQQDLLLPFSTTYNAFDEKARGVYWRQLNENLFVHGVDAWWCDSSEPFTPEWNHIEKPIPANMYKEYVQSAEQQAPLALSNAYGLFHARGVYEGQRSVTDQKRVVNLTRSGSIGSQRYGAILWSGDTSASWETLRKQIAAGLNFCASGLPYWTMDIGAFFVKKGLQWYWDGDYEQGSDDPKYRELFARWYQLGCFLPIFRAHGTDVRRELWHYGEPGDAVYDSLVKTNRLRYQLLPYIYSEAGKVWKNNGTLMRMLAFDFPLDERAIQIKDQYLFGENLMVCPVTEPMYDASKGEVSLRNSSVRKVYLPAGADWYNFWTGRHYEGGQDIMADAPLDMIPLYVKAGSILPMQQPVQYADQPMPVEFHVYTGKDAEYELYEDAGDGYAYERGEYSVTILTWDQARETLEAQVDGVKSSKEIKSRIIRP